MKTISHVSAFKSDKKTGVSLCTIDDGTLDVIVSTSSSMDGFSLTRVEAKSFLDAVFRAFYGPGADVVLDPSRESIRLSSILARDAMDHMIRVVEANASVSRVEMESHLAMTLRKSMMERWTVGR